jgi:hypothetical protein
VQEAGVHSLDDHATSTFSFLLKIRRCVNSITALGDYRTWLL